MMVRVHRPRVEGAREEEILTATTELLLEVGYDRLTMDAVARRARASKATLYRRWESKASLVVEALLHSKNAPAAVDPDTGNLRDDLLANYCGSRGLSKSGTQVLGAVLTAVNTDPDFARLFREKFMEPKVAITQAIYRRAQERGEIPEGVDVDLIGPALAGVLLHRSFVLGIDPDDATVERVIDNLILPAVRYREPQHTP